MTFSFFLLCSSETIFCSIISSTYYPSIHIYKHGRTIFSFIIVLFVLFSMWYINCRLHAASKSNKPKQEQHEQTQRTNIFAHCVMIDDTKIKNEWKAQIKALFYIESTKSIEFFSGTVFRSVSFIFPLRCAQFSLWYLLYEWVYVCTWHEEAKTCFFNWLTKNKYDEEKHQKE